MPVQSELTFRQMVDGIAALLAVLTPDGAVEDVNRQVLDYFGKTREELKGWASSDAVHPDDLPRVSAVMGRSIETGEPYDVQLRQRRADGAYRWFHVQGLPVRDAQGCVVRWCILQTDIDERKHAEEALRERERELRQLIDSVPAMIAVAGADGHRQYANKRAIDYLDTTHEGFREGAMAIVHPDDRELLRGEWLRCNTSGQPMDLVHRVRRVDGVYRWVHVRGEPLLDEAGRIVRWYYVFTDVDDQRKAEESLRQSEQHLRLLVETIPALVGRTTPEGRLDYVNRRAAEYVGKGLGELDIRAVHPDDRYSRMRKWRHALRTGEPWEDTYRLQRADGEYRWFYERSEPLSDQDGRLVCWYSVSFDINDSREIEDALRNTRQKLSVARQIATVAELSASIAHEINQPLASVVTNAHACRAWLSHEPPNLERAGVTLDRIIRDGHSAADVVRRIRALFRQAAPVKSLLDVNQVVAEVLGLLTEELRGNGVVVDADLATDLPMIEADQVQIQQVLINLVHNAIDAMSALTHPARPAVVSTRRGAHEVLIEVRDHGVGVSDQALIFEPFVTTKPSGMGMGLAISRSIIEAHGGRLWAAANDDGGMSFSVTLPIPAATAA